MIPPTWFFLKSGFFSPQNKHIFIEVYLTYNAVLVSGVQQSGSNTHTHTHAYVLYCAQSLSCVRLWNPMICSTRLLSPWGFSRQEYWDGLPCSPPVDCPNAEIEPRSPTMQADSLLSKSSGMPKNTGVGSLSLLQGIFPTQEQNGSPVLQTNSPPTELPGKPYICMYIYPFSDCFHYRCLQVIEYSSLCHTVSPVVNLFYLQQCVSVNLKLLIYPTLPFPFGNHKFVLYVLESISFFKLIFTGAQVIYNAVLISSTEQ